MKVVTLENFIKEEIGRVHSFKRWYTAMHKLNPNEFPLAFEEDNMGLWDEALGEFSAGEEVYSLKN